MPAIHRNKKPLITNTGIWDQAGEVPSHSSSDCLRTEFDKFLQIGSCTVTGVISLGFSLKGLYFNSFLRTPQSDFCANEKLFVTYNVNFTPFDALLAIEMSYINQKTKWTLNTIRENALFYVATK